MDLIPKAQDRNQWLVVVNTVMNHRVPQFPDKPSVTTRSQDGPTKLH
jgi:hypothetical protein